MVQRRVGGWEKTNSLFSPSLFEKGSFVLLCAGNFTEIKSPIFNESSRMTIKGPAIINTCISCENIFKVILQLIVITMWFIFLLETSSLFALWHEFKCLNPFVDMNTSFLKTSADIHKKNPVRFVSQKLPVDNFTFRLIIFLIFNFQIYVLILMPSINVLIICNVN